jgi:very-short-patch-repair endonuclease
MTGPVQLLVGGGKGVGGEGGTIMPRDVRRICLAQSLRKQVVPAEALLWKALRNRALAGFKFRRQHPVGTYVVDFAYVECTLVVELDGASHLPHKNADQDRTRFLEAAGWYAMRFWNTEVYDDLEPVKEALYRQCVARSRLGEPP